MHSSSSQQLQEKANSAACLEVDTLLALEDANEFTRDDSALVDQLVEGMLAVGARLSKVDLTRLERQPCAVNGNTLAIALHRNLNTTAKSYCMLNDQSSGAAEMSQTGVVVHVIACISTYDCCGREMMRQPFVAFAAG